MKRRMTTLITLAVLWCSAAATYAHTSLLEDDADPSRSRVVVLADNSSTAYVVEGEISVEEFEARRLRLRAALN